MTTFTDLGLDPRILSALTTEGYTTPTPIQAQAIPSVMQGRDLLGIAQTGTGKTAAFALPILHRLAQNPVAPRHRTTRVLVLSPTRELASQIAESFKTYGRNFNLKIVTIFGGVSFKPQIQALNGGADVIVATPGRLLDHMSSRMLSLDQTEILVLDEADQMMDLGFIQPLRQIVSKLPKTRQTLFFSATMPREISELADGILHNPEKISVTPAAKTADRVEQKIIFVEQAKKRSMLAELFTDAAMTRTLVFTRTKRGADRVARHLNSVGVPVSAIHGNKSQSQREQAMNQFKGSKIRALIATDIAARGIDIDAVSHVVNYELPNVPESYVHRIGRTARAGAEGIAISLVDGDERAYLRDIERLTRQQIPSTDRRGDSTLAVVVNDHKAEREEEEAHAAGDKRRSAPRTPRPFGGGRPSFNKGGDRGGFKGRRDDRDSADRGSDRGPRRDFKPKFDNDTADLPANASSGYDPLNTVKPDAPESQEWSIPTPRDREESSRPPRFSKPREGGGGYRGREGGGFNKDRGGDRFSKPRDGGFRKPRDAGDRPARFEGSGDRKPRFDSEATPRPEGDRPNRFDGDRPRSFKPREGGDFKPRRDNDDRGPRRDGGFSKGREGGFNKSSEGGFNKPREGGFNRGRDDSNFKPRDGGFKGRDGGGFNKPRDGGDFKPRENGPFKPRDGGDRGERSERSFGSKPAWGNRDRKPFNNGGDRAEGSGDRKPRGEFRKSFDGPRGDRNDGPRKPWANRDGGNRDTGGDRPAPRGDRPDRGGDRPQRSFERRPDSRGPSSDSRPERREGGFSKGGGFKNGFKGGGYKGKSAGSGGAPRSSSTGGEGRLSRPRAAKD